MKRRTNTAKWIEKNKRWQIKVQKDGVRRAFFSSTPGRSGQRECNAKADAWLDEGIVDSGIKVEKLFDAWIEELKVRTGKSHWTLQKYIGKRYIKPCIGYKKISAINEQHLQEVILYAHKIGNNGVGLAYKTLKSVRDCSVAFIKYARKCKATTLHPEDLIIPTTASRSKRNTLQPNDLQILFSHDKTLNRKSEVFEWFIYAFRFQVITGMRPGEICGLMESDIDNDICSIRRAINVHCEITSGKNDNALRSYIIPKLGMEVLADQKFMLKKAGVISPYVFPAPDCGHFIQQTYYKHWRNFRDYNGISKRMPYELRHTFFSANKQIPVELLKPMGGHGQDFDTQGVYGHALHGEAEQTAQMVDNNFRRLLKK